MKICLKSMVCLVIGLSLSLTSCDKECEKVDDDFGNEEAVLFLENGYATAITTPIEKPADFVYNTKGIIEYSKNGNVIAQFDYGNGTRDANANSLVSGNSANVDLAAKNKSSKYTKVITSPLIKITGCNYIVAGTIDYYYKGTFVATVDFGEGNCDDLATKTWPAGSDGGKSWSAGSKLFSLKK